MKHTLRSPVDRFGPLALFLCSFLFVGAMALSGAYRDNKVLIWGIAAGIAGVAFVVWLIVRLTASSRRRICDRCGIGVSHTSTTCRKCGVQLAWWNTRPLVSQKESPIPALRKMARESVSVVTLLFVPLLIVGLAIDSLWVFLLSLLAMVAAVIVTSLAKSRKLKSLRLRLQHANGRLCTVCLYQRNDRGIYCPECGVSEDERELQVLWERSGLWVQPFEQASEEPQQQLTEQTAKP